MNPDTTKVDEGKVLDNQFIFHQSELQNEIMRLETEGVDVGR
jgi:hypothetical protein